MFSRRAANKRSAQLVADEPPRRRSSLHSLDGQKVATNCIAWLQVAVGALDSVSDSKWQRPKFLRRAVLLGSHGKRNHVRGCPT